MNAMKTRKPHGRRQIRLALLDDGRYIGQLNEKWTSNHGPAAVGGCGIA